LEGYGISALLFQAFALKEGLPWQTMAFTALVIGRMRLVMGLRSEHDSLLKIGVSSNKPLLGVVLLTLIILNATSACSLKIKRKRNRQ
jgi:Ca2+-transporting ATPase